MIFPRFQSTAEDHRPGEEIMGKSTEQFAAGNLVKAESVRSRLSRTGSYFGHRPTKLPNGRLDWNDEPTRIQASPGVTTTKKPAA
jgi:hypothetical protein